MDIVFTALITCAICSAVVASLRGANGGVWFALGFLLGPLGFALAFTKQIGPAGRPMIIGAEQSLPPGQASHQAAATPCGACREYGRKHGGVLAGDV